MVGEKSLSALHHIYPCFANVKRVLRPSMEEEEFTWRKIAKAYFKRLWAFSEGSWLFPSLQNYRSLSFLAFARISDWLQQLKPNLKHMQRLSTHHPLPELKGVRTPKGWTVTGKCIFNKFCFYKYYKAFCSLEAALLPVLLTLRWHLGGLHIALLPFVCWFCSRDQRDIWRHKGCLFKLCSLADLLLTQESGAQRGSPCQVCWLPLSPPLWNAYKCKGH